MLTDAMFSTFLTVFMALVHRLTTNTYFKFVTVLSYFLQYLLNSLAFVPLLVLFIFCFCKACHMNQSIPVPVTAPSHTGNFVNGKKFF